MEQLDKEQGPKRGISRRTIVKGAAWSLPVVAAAVAAPMAAASGEGISGTSPVPSGVCSPVGNFTISVTTNGSPTSGASVTVALPAGFAWSDASTAPKSFVTTANGTVTITGVTGPSAPGTYYVIATVGSGAGAVSANIPIMIQGAWVAAGPGATGTKTHGIYINPVDVSNLGATSCYAYCIEHNVTAPNGKTVFLGAPSTFLGNNHFNNGGDYYNYLLGAPATLSAAAVQAKVDWIIQHSYPMVSIAAIEAATGQTGLQVNDVIEAAQYAIWSYTDQGYIDSNWSFADGGPSNQTPRYLQGKAVFTYFANGAWNDTATAPSSCLQVVSSSPSSCTTPTTGSHMQSLAIVCNCA